MHTKELSSAIEKECDITSAAHGLRKKDFIIFEFSKSK